MKKIPRALMGLALAASAGLAQAAAAKPNVLLIMLDDLNTEIGAYGGRGKTPNMDRFAARAVKFDNAYSVVPACNPSRVAMLTGQRPETTGQYVNPGDFRKLPGGPERVTLPQLLRQHGYEAVAAGKIFHHPRGAAEQPEPLSDAVSWDFEPRVPTGVGNAAMLHDASGGPAWLKGATSFEGKPISPYLRKEAVWGPVDVPKETSGDFRIAQYCADYLNTKHDKPFMLACGLSRPHSPHIAPREFFDRYPLDQISMPEVQPDEFGGVPAIARSNFSTSFVRAMRADPTEWKRAVQGYLASISFADEAVGKILDGLARSPNAENTIVILMGDNGFHMGQKERWEKFTLWDLGGHTPLIMKLPGVGPRVVKPAVTFLDLYPTVLGALGLPRPAFLEGRDLQPLIANPQGAWPHPAVMTYEPGNHAVRYGPWNFIHYRDGSEELYNLERDPHEFHNLIAAGLGEHAALVVQLRQNLPKPGAPMPGKPSL